MKHLRRSFDGMQRYRGVVAIVAALSVAGSARAGGGPENVFLVVNARSWASKTVANHFIHGRNIPTSNVLELKWTGPLDTIDIRTFREQILRPIFTTIQRRRLDDHIDYIVYSSDLPWCVDARSEFSGQKIPEVLTPIGSLTGLTYFAGQILSQSAGYLAFDANRYVRPIDGRPGVASTRAFRSWYGWGDDGALLEAGGAHYMLSTMLAVTSGRGNSVAEAIEYLKRTVEADGTRPRGTIYYTETEDVRSKTRRPSVASAVAALERLSVRAQVGPWVVPPVKSDVQGLTMGAAEFDWAGSHSQIRPGAIADNLTSVGGDMHVGASQTPLTEFLRFGAAGASGTVAEPYAIQAKFPLPQIHVHYARGCSLAEALYQSVACPYQLLIVGDPLCQPWTTTPEIQVDGVPSDRPVRGLLNLFPTSRGTRLAEIDRYEWFLDGVRVARSPRAERVTLNTASMPDGYHELRVVGAEPGDIETQGRAVVALTVDNEHRSAELSRNRAGPVRWSEPLELMASASGAELCEVVHHHEVVAKVDGPEGTCTIDPRMLGMGPVRLHVIASAKGHEKRWQSPPLELTIEPNEPLAAVQLAAGKRLAPGFVVAAEGKPPKTIVVVTNAFWLADADVRAEQKFDVEGYMDLKMTDTYQFHLRHHGSLTLTIDDQQIYDGAGGDYQLQMVPIALAQGVHHVELRGQTGARVELELGFGGPGVRPINGTTLQHLAN